MAKDICSVLYDETFADKWDKFVLEDSANGTFLQTRKFLNYHPQDRFQDNSLIFLNGGTIVAVLPACVVCDEKKSLYSHLGSTFGGLIVHKQFCKIVYLDLIFERLNQYLLENGFKEVILKQTGRIYQNTNTELLDYYFFLNGYSRSQEVGFYIDFSEYMDDVISNFSSSRRRDYRYALKNNFSFKKLGNELEIRDFYLILCDNYKKFDKEPIHSVSELLDFKFSRLVNNVDFYGVYLENELIAGGMVFSFGKRVLHTQYLAVRQNKINFFASEYLYKNLIECAKEDGYKYISFGTSTLNGGKTLNRQLAQYKEGFGTTEYVNNTYIKIFE